MDHTSRYQQHQYEVAKNELEELRQSEPTFLRKLYSQPTRNLIEIALKFHDKDEVFERLKQYICGEIDELYFIFPDHNLKVERRYQMYQEFIRSKEPWIIQRLVDEGYLNEGL